MFPHERSLVQKLKDQPFALIGVNSDPKDVLRKAMESEHITWRSFWDGGGTSGPIATSWNVRGWPTIFVLDAEGVIRGRDLRDEALEKRVEELLASMKKKGAPAEPAEKGGGG